MPAKLGGVDQYLYTTLFGAHGVSAEDGRQLWHFPFKFNVSASPSPVALDGERVYVTAGYDSGGAMLRVRREGDAFAAEEVFVHAPEEWNSEVQTPIVHQGHLFAVGKKKRGLFTCLDGDGKQVWTSDGKASFDLGSFLLADGMFFILDGRTGILRLVEANLREYHELASAQILSGHDVWAPLALSEGKLVIRDLQRMVCLQVGKDG
ncbi:MAG: PQQ-binding-like beta-propeller repeat protein [Thermoanaerobaculia bacterium]